MLSDDEIRLVMQNLSQLDVVRVTGICKQWHGVGGQLLPLFPLSECRGGSTSVRLSRPEHQPRTLLRDHLSSLEPSWVAPGQGRRLEILAGLEQCIDSHVLPHIRACVSAAAPVHDLVIRSTHAGIEMLMTELSQHVATCASLSVSLASDYLGFVDDEMEFVDEESKLPAPTRTISELVAMHPSLRGLSLHAHEKRLVVDMRLINSMTNLTTLRLHDVILDHCDLLKLPSLTHLSLVDTDYQGDKVRCVLIANHHHQLRSLQLQEMRVHDRGLGAEDLQCLARCTNLTTLDVSCSELSDRIIATLSRLPSLGYLAVKSFDASLGISPHVTRLRTMAASGMVVSSILSHIELILSYGCHSYGGPLVLPDSITTAYLPVSEVSAAFECSRLRSLSLYIPPYARATPVLEAIWQRNGEGVWPDLTRLAIMPPSHVVHHRWDLTGRGVEEWEYLEALLDIVPPRALTHVTIMQARRTTCSVRLFHALQGIVTLRSLILVHLPIDGEQLEALARLPVLGHIELVCTEGVTQGDCRRVSRRADRASRQDGRCALSVTLVEALSSFNFTRDEARFV